jgi:alanine-glyoxylate transaminase/serine-glyoxylate transaminase/serine-pyruvate transaminase
VTNPFLKKQMYSSFIPPKRILMGPGPSDVPQRVLDASARQTIGHLDPFFLTLMDEIKVMLQQAYKTDNALTMPVSAPGSSGMETCFVNLVEPGETVLVCINGVFGGRMKENVERCGATAIVVEDDWGTPVSLEKVEQVLNEHPQIKLVAFVHAETSTGASSDAQQITRLAHQRDAMVIVDAVTSLAGSPLEVDAWDLDAIYSGSQKCLSCLPGLSPVSFNDRAVEKIRNRKSKVQSWFMDLNLVMGYWGSDGARSYHHTAPVNSLYALHESLLMLHEEGLENSWARHQKNHQLLKAGLAEMGIEFLVDEAYRLPQLNTVYIPEGVDDAALRRNLLENYQLEIGAGIGALAGKVWRIGLMGYASREENVELCLRALKETI